MTGFEYICTMHAYICEAQFTPLDGLNTARIASTGGIISMENSSILARLPGRVRAAFAGALDHIRRLGTRLREAAAIAFTLRCRVIDRR
ncbi:hypothetical protein [Rhizobium lusitanum]|uniref:Uncharacterized protein n=1 Tax=Rhizobium lusitanum TaxID=293958 RepID=A0A7X0IT99_9HYPH|nr:hypothetical protein [Rhizobium lusitanum]MBB6486358.1 hypothetical protein [Rhizobium lusitanum]